MILEAILGKIKLYEKGQDKKWTELIQVRVVFEDFSGTQNTFSPFPEYWQPVLRRRWRWIWFRLVAYWRLNNWILYFTSQKPKFLFFEFTNATPEKNWNSFRIDQHNVYHSFFLADSVLIWRINTSLMSPGEVWLDDKNSQTVRVETIQVGQR